MFTSRRRVCCHVAILYSIPTSRSLLSPPSHSNMTIHSTKSTIDILREDEYFRVFHRSSRTIYLEDWREEQERESRRIEIRRTSVSCRDATREGKMH